MVNRESLVNTKNNYKENYKESELSILRAIFVIAGIISPIITYLWAYIDTNSNNNIYLGWFMSIMFLVLFTLSYKSSVIKKKFVLISFIMFILCDCSALYYAAINGFDDEYTLLFFIVIFATTLFFQRLSHLLKYHAFIFTFLLFANFHYGNDNNRKIIVIFIYSFLAIITGINSYLIFLKQEKINKLVYLIKNINQSYSFNETLEYIYMAFSSFIPYSHIGIGLVKDDGENIEASYGIGDGSLAGLSENLLGLIVKIDDTNLKEAIVTGKALIINDFEKHVKNKPIKDYNKIIIKAGIKSSIAFPIITNTKAVGVIFFSSKNKNVYTHNHENFLETLASSISLSFEKCILMDDLIYRNIMSLVKLAELRDGNTGDHLDRMKIYSREIAKLLSEDSIYKEEISSEYIKDIEKFSPIHDIGKVGINDGILLKPGKLTCSEFEEMKKHTIYGAEVVRSSENNSLGDRKSLFKMGIEIIESHHEKWDGTGYPFSKKGTEIPLSARIVAVADVFDALASKRPYKEAFSFEESFNIILEGKGKHFDPEIVRVFEKNKDIIYEIYSSHITEKPSEFELTIVKAN